MLAYLKHALTLITSPTGKSISQVMSANFISATSGFLTSVLILRNLPANEISIIYPLIGMMLICAQFSDLGISQPFVKIASSLYATDKKKSLRYFNITLKSKLVLIILIFLIGLTLSPFISQWLLKSKEYTFLVALTFFATIFQALAAYYSSTFQIENRIITLSIIRTIPPILKLVIIIFLLINYSLNLYTAILAFFLVPITAGVLGIIHSSKEIYRSPSSLEELKEILKYSKWVLIATICTTLIGQVDILMIKKMAAVEQVSILIGGQRLASVLPLITSALVTILLPKVSSMKNNSELNYFFRKSLYLLPITIGALSLLFLIASPLITTILGDRYILSIPTFKLYLLGFGICIFITPLSLILYKLNKEYVFAYIAIAQLIINIVGNYILIPIYASAGAAAVSAATKLLTLIVILTILYREGIIFYHIKKRSSHENTF